MITTSQRVYEVTTTLLHRDRLADLAKALGHPARVCIVEQLARAGRLTAGEIVAGCGLAQSTVSEHLRILRTSDLVSCQPDGPKNWYEPNLELIAQFARNVMYLTAPGT